MTISTPCFSTIGLVISSHYRQDNQRLLDVIATTERILVQCGSRPVLCISSANAQLDSLAWTSLTHPEIPEEIDLLIAIGGDGTFLNAAHIAAPLGIPVVGIHAGRLGFMADITTQDLQTSLVAILEGQYVIEQRLMLQAEIQRQDQCLATGYALNDVVINKRDIARMMEYDISIDGRYVSNHRADGLIVATPTGSTAYALSSGGPIIYPDMDAIVLVPICPHTLSDRSMVINGRHVIEVEVEDRHIAHTQLTCDGQRTRNLAYGDTVRVQCAPFRLMIVHPLNHDYFKILRAKLNWGKGNKA